MVVPVPVLEQQYPPGPQIRAAVVLTVVRGAASSTCSPGFRFRIILDVYPQLTAVPAFLSSIDLPILDEKISRYDPVTRMQFDGGFTASVNQAPGFRVFTQAPCADMRLGQLCCIV